VVYEAIFPAKALSFDHGSKRALAVVVPFLIFNLFSLNMLKCSNIKQHCNEGQKSDLHRIFQNVVSANG
jgi:hypothetical protein